MNLQIKKQFITKCIKYFAWRRQHIQCVIAIAKNIIETENFAFPYMRAKRHSLLAREERASCFTLIVFCYRVAVSHMHTRPVSCLFEQMQISLKAVAYEK